MVTLSYDHIHTYTYLCVVFCATCTVNSMHCSWVHLQVLCTLLSAVFLYSCPGFKSTIKERMLYSSCKEPVVSVAEKQLGLQVAKKVCLCVCVWGGGGCVMCVYSCVYVCL